jgi:hypothetical protein
MLHWLLLLAVGFIVWDWYKETTNPGSSMIFSRLEGTAS